MTHQNSSFSFFDNIRDKVNVSDIIRQTVSLTRKGQEYSGLCPFHNEKTPSFTVNDIKKFYHCFGCGAHGDVIKFLVETKGFSYLEAAKKLATDNGIEIPEQTTEQKRIYEQGELVLHALSLASEFFVKQINKNVMHYLSERRLSEDNIAKYSIGFSSSGKELIKYMEECNIPLTIMHDAGLIGKNDDGEIYPVFRNRIMFPIRNIYSKIIAFGGRAIGDAMPKYLNSPESIVFRKSETLYGEEIATGPAYQKKRIIIVEGYIDVIAMHNAGFLETVATLGTAVTKDHLNKLWRIADEVIFCLDGDRAGQNAMKKAINLVLPLLTNYKKASFLILPNKLDPDDVIKQFGREYIEKLIEKRIATSEMIWHLETINKKFDNPESRAALEIRLLQYAQLVQSETLKNYIKRDIKNKMWNFGRNTSKNSKKVLVKNNILENIGSEKEIIAYNLCAMIMAHPDLLNDEKTQDAFMNLEFTNTLLTDLQSFLIELHSRHKDINFDLIKEKMQKSRFSDLFVLLSSDNTSFIDKLSLDNETNTVLWALYLKKYELELLKEEYSNIIKSDQKNGFDKAMAYLKEIEKIEVDIKELSETL